MKDEYLFLILILSGGFVMRFLDSYSNGGNFEMYTWTIWTFLLMVIAWNSEKNKLNAV